MKKFTLSFILYITIIAARAQNMVPNGDFEQHIGCPNYFYQIDSCTSWMSPTVAKADYFNQCATVAVGVPDNNYTHQDAHSGGAYVAVTLRHGLVSLPNYRTYIEVPLTSTLSAGACYHFEMYVNLIDHGIFTTDAIQAYFSDTLVQGIFSYNPLPFTPQITSTAGFITDSINWTLVEGTFTAAGTENYLIIGNFKDDANTDTMVMNSNGYNYAEVLIDDVSLVNCTGINENNQSRDIIIYPNPVSDELFITNISLAGKAEISIKDVLGKEVYRTQLQTLNFKLQTNKLSNGIYFLEINDGKNSYRKMFLKQSF
jgi:OOP family OmpA-OmpF porin